MRMWLTDDKIAALPTRRKEYLVRDRGLPGLAVRVRSSGGKSFVTFRRTGGKTKKLTIGDAARTTVDMARDRAAAIMAGDGGDDGRGTATLAAFVERDFLPAVATTWKPSSLETARHYLRARILPAFGDRALRAIDRRLVARWFDEYGAARPGGANRALEVLSSLFNHAVRLGHVETNPARGLRKNPRKRSHRFLGAAEIARLERTLAALCRENPNFRQPADIARLLLLTGCRAGEILGLEWDRVDGGVIRLADAKTGPRAVWLGPAARALIDALPRTDGRWVFPDKAGGPRRSIGHYWRVVRERAGFPDVRLHDLRHTFASHAVSRAPARRGPAVGAQNVGDDDALRPRRRQGGRSRRRQNGRHPRQTPRQK